jgi:ribosomal protein S18 acetylase RimI-like enzyme
VLIEETVTYLEMTSPKQLRAGRPPPAPVELQRLDAAASALVRSVYARIGAPHDWIGRRAWTDQQWRDWLTRPGSQPWIARVGGETAGFVELGVQPGGEVEIVVFGLVPEFIGRGFGGHLLTLASRLAWQAEHSDGAATRRVWLHTSSRDHPNAIHNYQRRGFRPFRTEQRQREIPDA